MDRTHPSVLATNIEWLVSLCIKDTNYSIQSIKAFKNMTGIRSQDRIYAGFKYYKSIILLSCTSYCTAMWASFAVSVNCGLTPFLNWLSL
jgi:hypothetical protein